MSHYARMNPEEARRDAFAADIAMEEYRNAIDAEEEPPDEPEPDPLLESMHEVWDRATDESRAENCP